MRLALAVMLLSVAVTVVAQNNVSIGFYAGPTVRGSCNVCIGDYTCKKVINQSCVAEVKDSIGADTLEYLISNDPDLTLLYMQREKEVCAQKCGSAWRKQMNRAIQLVTEIEVSKVKSLEDKEIPTTFDFSTVPSLRLEARQKLAKIQPRTIGQAGQISGVSPADISILLVWLKRSGSGPLKTGEVSAAVASDAEASELDEA